MNFLQKFAWVLGVVAIGLAVIAFQYPKVRETVKELGRVGTAFPHGITVGPVADSPTNLNSIIAGTCDLTIYRDLAASSTSNYDCAVTGVNSGDIVLTNSRSVVTGSASSSATAGPNLFGSIAVIGASASTTAGYITFSLMNTTGASSSSFPGVASSVPYAVIETQ